MEKLIQGVHHYTKMGGKERTIIPKKFQEISTDIFKYLQLTHNISRLRAFEIQSADLTNNYFKNLTEASKDTWLEQANWAANKLRAKKLDLVMAESIMDKAKISLSTKTGKHIVPVALALKAILGEILEKRNAKIETLLSQGPFITTLHKPHTAQQPQKIVPLMSIKFSDNIIAHMSRKFPNYGPKPRKTTPCLQKKPQPETTRFKDLENFLEKMKPGLKIPNNLHKPGPTTTYARGPRDPLSNFYPHNIKLGNQHFCSNEQAYQCLKAVFYKNWEMAETILLTQNPFELKAMGNDLNKTENKHMVSKWDNIKDTVCLNLLEIKSKSCKKFREKLLSSRNSLIKHNVMDNHWGSKAMKNGYLIPGQNQFGNLLMAIRKGLRENEFEELTPQTTTNPRHPPTNVRNQTQYRDDQTNPRDQNFSLGLNVTEEEEQETTGDISEAALDRLVDHNTSQLSIASQIQNPPTPQNRLFSSQPPPLTSSPRTTPIATTQPQQSSIIGPQAHIFHTKSKTLWKIPHLNEEVCIIGDDNVHQISETPKSVRSIGTYTYPGARVMHLSNLFRADSMIHKTKQVILSIGIGGRENEIKTNTEQWAKLMSQFKKWHPNIKKSVALVQYDKTKFGPKTVETLEAMNKTIIEMATKHEITVLPLIDNTQIEVQNETLWTTKTANLILKSWANHLNWQRTSPTPQPP